jgi:hypothetical protein
MRSPRVILRTRLGLSQYCLLQSDDCDRPSHFLWEIVAGPNRRVQSKDPAQVGSGLGVQQWPGPIRLEVRRRLVGELVPL